MKNLACGIAVLTCLASTASAITRIGESAELFITADIRASTDDNIFLSDGNEVDDTIFELAPGIELTFGQGAKTSGSFEIEETFIRYLDNDSLDDELLSSVFNLSYDDAKLKLGLDASYRELNQSTRDVRGNTLVRRDVLNASADSEISISDKSSTGLGISWDDTDYNSTSYVDIEEITIPFNYYYAVSEKLDLSAGFRYRQTSLAISAGDSKDYYYNVGVRIPVTEKLSGYFSIGYNQRKPETGSEETGTGVDADFAYAITYKTTLSLFLGNDYTTSAEGISQKTMTIAPTLRTKFSSQWEGSLGLTYQELEYFSGRDDEYTDGRLGLAFLINDHAKISAAYTYRSNDSDQSGADFDNSIISLAANLRF